MSEEFKVEEHTFDILFPFYFVLNKDLKIIQAGRGLKKVYPAIISSGFLSVFKIQRPESGKKLTYKALLNASDQLFMLEIANNKTNLSLRGQMVETGPGMLLFAGSPLLEDIEDLSKFGLLTTDFAIHDPLADMLHTMKLRELALDDILKQRDELIRKNQEIEDLAKFPSENPNPVFRISITGKIRYANKASEILMKAWKCRIGKNYPKVLQSAIRETVLSNAPLEAFMVVGEKYFNLLFTPFLENGYINVYGNDVTEKYETEKTLKASEERFKQLVEDASDIIYRADFQGYFTYVNPMAERIVKRKADEIDGIHFSELVPDEWKEEVIKFYQLQFGKRIQMTYYEFPVIDREGNEIWLGQNVLMLTEGERITGFQAVARDITERKLMEESLKMAKERAEESLRIKEDFMANMSHEIRTPMHGILGMSKLLSTADLSEKHRHYLNAIQNSANNLLVIINDILDLSKIEAGKLDLEMIGFDLMDVINSTMENIEYLAAEKHLQVHKNLDKKLIGKVMLGDTTRLGQVLTNLMSNAVKFTEKGSVTLVCELKDENEEFITLDFSVIDTGIGISREKLDSIFESFSQADSSTTRKYGGTGLGLAICKRLIELQGGEISVESRVGTGSTFRFTIPYRKGHLNDLPGNGEQPGFKFDLHDVKVLLVEDHKINQVYAKNIMEDKGMQVDLAENGLEALKFLEQHKYDIVLMDIQMPVMGGIETTRIIRKKLRLDIPIVALTANAIKGEADKYIKAGMNEYVSKPFNDTELFSKIARLLKLVPVYSPSDASLNRNPREVQENLAGDINPSAARLYDLQKLEQMSGTKKDFVDKMVKMFIEEMPKSLNTLNDHMAKKEYEKVRAVAHKMKPALHIMGILTVEKEVRMIEEYALQQTNLDQLPYLVHKVVSICETILEQLKLEYS